MSEDSGVVWEDIERREGEKEREREEYSCVYLVQNVVHPCVLCVFLSLFSGGRRFACEKSIQCDIFEIRRRRLGFRGAS